LLGLQAEDDDGNKASQATKVDNRALLSRGSTKWKSAIQYIENGGSLEEIEKKYKLTKEQRKDLASII